MQALALLAMTGSLVTLTTLSAQAAIFKCVVDGKVTYQSRQCSDDTQQTKITTKGASKHSGQPWHRLQLNMSPSQTQQTISGLQQTTEGRLATGANAKFKKTGWDIGSQTFIAKYYFIGDKLKQVNISNGMNRNKENKKIFDTLYADFVQRYGNARDEKRRETSTSLSYSSYWSTSQGTVWLAITPVTSRTSLLTYGIKLGQ